MQLCFGGAPLGLSARRIWEHVALRQVNPFTPLRTNASVRAEEFVDVIQVETARALLTGTTLADVMAGDTGELAASSVQQLRANVARPGTQRWLVHVKRSIQTYNQRLSTRNLPAPFLPPGSAYPLGVPGLRNALASWLQDRANEKATGAEWLRRIHNLRGRGLRREELFASSVESILARQGSRKITARNLAAALAYSEWRLSILPALSYSSQHLQFASIAEADSIKRVKPRLPRGLESRPLWRDPVLGYWIDVIDWNDLLGEHRGWMAFTCRGEPVTSHERPGGLCDSPEAAVKLANRHASRLMPKMSTRGIWSGYRLNGGADYREWLITVPYFRTGYFSSHFEHRNVLLHVRADIRETEFDERVLVLQEVQSDWAQQARRRTGSERESGSVPEPPWMKEWPALALKLMLLHVAYHGLDGLAWTPGNVQKTRYGRYARKGLIELYDRTLPRELDRLLRPHAKRCGRVEIYHPVDFSIEPWVSGYLVSDKEGRQLGVADTWADVQRLLPDGALERLRGMHGVRLDQKDRASILNDGFFAWGMGIR
jgi:hypothetical protein